MLVVGKASIHTENVSTKTRRNLPLFNGWLVSEIYLCGKMSANLVGGEKRGVNVRIMVCLLTSGTSLGQII